VEKHIQKSGKWTRREVMRCLSAMGVMATASWPHKAYSLKSSGKQAGKSEDIFEFVNIAYGTGGHGHTYPGATVPFGMVQLSPDTGLGDWDHCSGYHLSDSSIIGFSHTHLSGTGCADLADFLVMPRNGEVKIKPGDGKIHGSGYRSQFSHANEHMHPGYYSVLLDDCSIRAELTATEHAGFHRYTFPESETSHIVLDFTHSFGEVSWCTVRVSGNDTILAGHATKSWADGREMYIAMQFSKPFERVQLYYDDQPVDAIPDGDLHGKSVKAVVFFKTSKDEQILIRTGLSGVSTEGAAKNLAAEIPDWKFEKIQHQAETIWRRQLEKIQIESADKDRKSVFYSTLYHTMLAPTLFDDVDGCYHGMDGKIHQLAKGQRNYTVFSLWDTYRAEHPLLTLLHADRVPDMVNSLIRMAEESPEGVPVWPLQGKETGCMTGYHSSSVIAEAFVKGFKGIDYARAYAAFKKRSFKDNYRGLNWYRSMGFIPADLEEESVSKTLEYDYDDWAVAHMAARLGYTQTAKELVERSKNYRHLWEPESKFLRAKLKDGSWATPFDPIEMGHFKKWRDYTESNSWQTTFGIQHDIAGYIELFGGDEPFIQKLDKLFNQSSALPPDAPPDIAGMIGQYAHGNEPSHHIAYMYAYAGAPWKTQERIHYLNMNLYSNAPDGMAGNEDCGQMSAWFVMSALGIYAVDPASAYYVFGTPLFERATVQLAGGKELVIEAQRQTPESIYIHGAQLNGKPYEKLWIEHAQLANGARLRFNLQANPDLQFGVSKQNRPISRLRLS
jgi:predicted alpha-1,2-mannosidase